MTYLKNISHFIFHHLECVVALWQEWHLCSEHSSPDWPNVTLAACPDLPPLTKHTSLYGSATLTNCCTSACSWLSISEVRVDKYVIALLLPSFYVDGNYMYNRMLQKLIYTMPILVWAQSVHLMFNSFILKIWQVNDTFWSDFKFGRPRMLSTAHFHFHNLDLFSIFHFVLLHDWIPIVSMVLVCLSINCSHQPLWDCISFSSCPENRATDKASFSWLRATSHSGTVHFLFMENKQEKNVCLLHFCGGWFPHL